MKIANAIILVFMVLVLLACGEVISKNGDSDVPLDSITVVDSNRLQAIATAKSSIDYFVKSFKLNASNDKMQFSVKKIFKDKDMEEAMWVCVKKIEADTFYGTLTDIPQMVDDIKEGDSTAVEKCDVIDWMIIDAKNKKVEGGFINHL